MSEPYRDDTNALSLRLAALLERLDAIRKASSELRDLERAEAEVEREIEEVRQRLAKRTGRAGPSLLDRAVVASPCPVPWDDMKGDDRTRFCGQCEKNVHNLSGMSRDEAEGFLRGLAGEACVQLYRRRDGTVMTADCPDGVKRKRRRRIAFGIVSGGLVSAAALVASDRAADVKRALGFTGPDPQVVFGGGMFPAFSPAERRASYEAHLAALFARRTATSDPAARSDLEGQIKQTMASIAALDAQPMSTSTP
jgi:hypothetical protein